MLPQPWLAQTRVYYQWSRLEQLDQWWHYLLFLVAVIGVISYVIWWYRHDSHEQQRPVRWALLMLRLVAFAGLILYFFQLDKRSELRVTRNSRVAILVDTSLSMSLPGTSSASGATSSQTRADEAAQLIGASPVLGELAKQHDVTVYRFDQLNRPVQIAALARPTAISTASETQRDSQLVMLSRAHWLMLAACFLGAVALLLVCVSFGSQIAGARTWSGGGWSLFSGSVLAMGGMMLLAFAILPASDYPLEALLIDPAEAVVKYQVTQEDPLSPQLTQAGGNANIDTANQPNGSADA
ncbi:MAG: hypothetical protein IT423_11255, partial [Pirellulaceae bacterium]|nr:hypothetical protein [Pirellulaceae bacterium]